MAKFKIPVTGLPPTKSDGHHIVRFRVTTEDRNNISEWSRLFDLESSGQIPSMSASYLAYLTPTNPKTINLIWEGDYLSYHGSLDKNPHDVFVKWDSEEYLYLGRELGNNFSILAADGKSEATFWVQVASYPEGERSTELRILETTPIDLT
jgi:hypothetical protein